jgi:phytoene synthase
MDLYNETCFACSKLITQKYSTSFSIGIRAFDKQFRNPIYAIYGFVRCADEIVDTFHHHDKHELIANFRQDTFKAIEENISLNPYLHAFQLIVNQYEIEPALIETFLRAMETDLDKTTHDTESYKSYIFGSAEVVGLMCLRVFCNGNEQLYRRLMPAAQSLGSAFQKVNFLRDAQADFEERGRTYFPGVDFKNFTEQDKQAIEADILDDFNAGLKGIKQLPNGTRLGVYIAYKYYIQLFRKISTTPAAVVLQKRIRLSDTRKASLFFGAVLKQKLNAI